MNYQTYQAGYESILDGKSSNELYQKEDYLNYAKLNASRSKRWDKTGQLSEDTIQQLKSIENKQHWILITEHWCGDAAHIVPFIQKMAEQNPLIELEIQLRDSDSEIDKYLTNGGKSIPILVIRNAEKEDLFHWGPRPKEAQDLFLQMKAENASFEEQKEKLQQWYNGNKGVDIQVEICALLRATATRGHVNPA